MVPQGRASIPGKIVRLSGHAYPYLAWDRSAIYRIDVQGDLDERWSDWFGEMAIAVEREGGGRSITTRTAFDDPLTVEALEWWRDLAHEHDVCVTSIMTGGHGWLFYLVRQGKVGI
jgi:hypothetical protein